MCRRYAIASQQEHIERKFLASFNYDFKPYYQVSPGLKAPVITCEAPAVIQGFQWGLIPGTSDGSRYLPLAQGEGIHTARHFMKPIREHRCLVLANCFYEWSLKAPYHPHLIYCTGSRLFAFGGVYRRWSNKQTKEEINCFAIVTTRPNSLMAHMKADAMPVILTESQARKWIKQETPLSDITAMIATPYPYGQMNAYPVGDLLLNPTDNRRIVMDPMGPRLRPEQQEIMLKRKRIEKEGDAGISLGERARRESGRNNQDRQDGNSSD